MKNPLTALFQNDKLKDFWSRLCIEAVGLAEDYWKDPKPADVAKSSSPVSQNASSGAKKAEGTPKAADQFSPASPRPKGPALWHADRYQVMEKIWGQGRTLPSNEDLEKLIVVPLGLNKEMTVLDLAAGLGGLARKLATEHNTYVTGLEKDEVMARRGMTLSLNAGKSKQAGIEPYNPAEFTFTRHYNCIIARELFYNILGKDKFFQAIASSLKQHGMMVFTDYILDAKFRENDAVKGWLAYEKDASPLSLHDMVQTWTRLKFDVRVNEDLTAMYRHEILLRLKNFAEFLARNPPDDDTKQYVFLETEKWARRAAAMQGGLKFYRFEVIKV